VSRRRKVLVGILVAVATLLLLISTLTLWTKRQVLDTDNWTTTSGQLLANDEVRAVLATKLIDLLYQRVNVVAALQARLPDQLDPAAPVAAAALRNAGTRAANTLLGTPAAQALWEQSNRRMHGDLVRLLEGKKLAHVTTQGGVVVLDLRPLLHRVAERLGVEEKLNARLPSTAGEIVILRSDQLDAAQKAVRVIRVFSIFLLIAVLVLYALAIYLARGSRRIVLEIVGGCAFFVGLVLLVVQRVVGNAIINSVVKTDANRPAGHEIWLIATSILRDIGIALVVYGLIVVAAGALAGPSRIATTIRRWLAPAFRRYVVAVYAVVIAVFLILVAWGPVASDRRLIGTLFLFALLLAGVEVLRRQTLREFPEESTPRLAGPPRSGR
jgi:hypothetical protein